MAAEIQPRLVLFLFLVFISAVPLSFCQSNSQNIQTVYPFPLPPIGWTPTSPNNESISPSKPPQPPPPLLPPPLQPPPPVQQAKSSSKGAVAKAVVATAASTLVLSGLFFFLLRRYSRRKRDQSNSTNPYSRDPVVPRNEFTRFDGNLKGLIVDEDGLDVLYWRNLEGQNIKDNFIKQVLANNTEQEKQRKKSELRIQEIPLLRGKSSTSHHQVWPEAAPPPPAIQSPPPPPPPPAPLLAIPKTQSPAPPLPPPIPAKKGPAPPPPPPEAAGLASSFKPPPARKGVPSENKQGESSSTEGMAGDGNGQVKLKPLHWDKVNANVDHSMVWHKMDGGSFRFDGDLMEALFGYIATNRKSPQRNSKSSSCPASPVFILDGQKSQNTAIVLRSIAISPKDIIEALLKGQGLNAETLERLTNIAPTKEEESKILAFDGDPTRLADAESFLYHLLRAVPSAFTLFSAMLFRSSYDSEILHLKKTLKTLELGCKELTTRGLFLKLLEAILKAGNHMNAGTSRGNAQAFNLTALRKLSDVKSIDGKTTLLHFVVEEVIRAEGKRCVINRNRSLSRSSSQNSDNSISKDDRDREYIMLGLPILGGFSAEFANLKKAATIDSDVFAKTCSALTARIAEIQRLLTQCGNAGGGGFLREMRSFLEAAEEEVKAVTEEQTKVMELVKRTTEYYQAGASKNKEKHALQLFVIVKDFLGMVDQVCIDIARNLQKRRTATTNVGSSQPKSLATRISVRFPILPENFMSEVASLQE